MHYEKITFSKSHLILRAFPTRATRLSSLLSESSEREVSKLSNITKVHEMSQYLTLDHQIRQIMTFLNGHNSMLAPFKIEPITTYHSIDNVNSLNF